ncbi:GIY-YIG nuclease family protein [Vibrio vulnificus]|uniref:GIY-YIG nuclease family protein n=1 Tax=Vibrio TaxID=662 RepID=UPI001D1C11C6|nr:GIY-YIG nuclease family protein [Vibrio sp. CCUG 15886]EGR0671660.1 GIY-YIG nuclease family protein [Vibrio vulnificus]MDC8111582.1 GIY-YIG nuclease family protein [Vibrio sp. CCUG 15886]
MNPGYIYIMEDQLNCNVVKIGFTLDPVERLRQLYNTSTPLPFVISYLWGVDDMGQAELAAHSVMYQHRINPQREFFFIVPPNSDLPGENCPETCSAYLFGLSEAIENAFYYYNVNYNAIDLEWFKGKYRDRLAEFPDSIKGF